MEIHEKVYLEEKTANNSHDHVLSMVHSNDKKDLSLEMDKERWAVGKKDEEFGGGQIK